MAVMLLPIVLVLTFWAVPFQVFATPGATEINQVSVEAGGGFPLVISSPSPERGDYTPTSV